MIILTISKQITTCYEYVELAERSALNGSFEDSNRFWRNASNIAISLLQKEEPGCFLDEEYKFLTQIANYFKDNDNVEYY